MSFGKRERLGKRGRSKVCKKATLAVGARRIEPIVQDVLAAVHTLYNDELQPFGRILRKRVAECLSRTDHLSDGTVDVDIDEDRLRSLCEDCVQLEFEADEEGQWFVLLRGVQATLVNIYSPHDVYPIELWNQARIYFESLPEGHVLPGGRCSCAKVLQERRLPFLRDYSFGKICHIVQLAISQKKILGYRNGTLVPYKCSRSRLKEQCALGQRPCGTATASATLPLATWETARAGLRAMLMSAPGPKPAIFPLSNVKRIFRYRFRLDLSETVLGYSKLCNLLQDDRFRDICSVSLDDGGYVVVEKTSVHEKQVVGSARGLLPNQEFEAPVSASVFMPSSDSCIPERSLPHLNLSLLSETDGYPGSVIRKTFIHVTAPDSMRAKVRSQSVPLNCSFANGSSSIGALACGACPDLDNLKIDVAGTASTDAGSSPPGSARSNVSMDSCNPNYVGDVDIHALGYRQALFDQREANRTAPNLADSPRHAVSRTPSPTYTWSRGGLPASQLFSFAVGTC